MIAKCRSKAMIFQLKEDNQSTILPHAHRGMKGHIIIYPQKPSEIAQLLPPPIEELITPMCVIFIGSTPPTQEWLKEKAKPLVVRKEKVQNALYWLKSHNPLYRDVDINYDVLNTLQNEQILPVHIEHILPENIPDVTTDRYDHNNVETNSTNIDNNPYIFEKVVITDVEGHVSTNELRSAAMRHVKQKGGSFIQIPHGSTPMNEFNNPTLFPMMYPTLYPYGMGGFEDCRRDSALSMKRHVKHL
ncbi:hypothetical protein K474DRAFT_1748012, partial [Panus rudis PR-1116 ss-1]